MRVLAILVILLALTGPAQAQLKLNATGTCTMWLEAGKNKVFRQIEEALVLGLIDGMSLGANMNFWVTREGQLKMNQALYWIDNYCGDNPLEHTVIGVWELFNSRAEPIESSDQ